ncbi:MAG TPA: hypothetical protein VE891_13845 [Allosphingosinicella sp.]|nr:hypothetical protein [Allosphingosinicella sp.]
MARSARRLGPEEIEAFERDWPTWAHEGQLPGEVDWSTCVIMGGRSFGKTRAGSEWIVGLLKGPDGTSPRNPLRIALVGATLAEARSVRVEGKSGLLEVAGPWIREWRRDQGLVKFRTGAQAQLFSGHTPEFLRSPEHSCSSSASAWATAPAPSSPPPRVPARTCAGSWPSLELS